MTPDEVRMQLLDELAELFKSEAIKHEGSMLTGSMSSGQWLAYHQVRAKAHEYGIHLSSCKQGRRVGDARRRWNDEDTDG